MCEKCEDNEQMKKIGCSMCSTGIKSEDMISDGNRIVTNHETEMKRIDEELKKNHKEIINGFDKQLEDCLLDLAKFSTKMLIMFEDYRKRGDKEEMVKVLQSINNYGIMSQTTSTVITQTINMLIEKVRNSD